MPLGFERTDGSDQTPLPDVRLPDYNPNCVTESRVYVNGVRLPVANTEVHIRKEGNLDFTRYAEAQFASPYNGTDYLGAFESNREPGQQGGALDTVRVDVKDYETDEYTVAFHGIVTGVNNDREAPSSIWRLRGQGPGMVLDKIPAAKRFTAYGEDTATNENVLQYITTEAGGKLPFTLSPGLPPTIDGQAIIGAEGVDEQGQPTTARELARRAGPTREAMQSARTFTPNKHTLADVVRWYRDKTATRIWFRPSATGVRLIITAQPTGREHVAHYLDGDLRVINNDALTELRPVNTLVMAGEAKQSLTPLGLLNWSDPKSEYAEAKARHVPLYERAGETEFHADVEQVADGQTKAEVEQEARSLLKQAVDETTGGDMQTLLRGPIRPFDTIRAKPTCDGTPATDVAPITYEVARVKHEIVTGNRQRSRTTLNVGIHTDMNEDIEVLTQWKNQ